MTVPTPKGYSNKYLVADAIGKHDGVAPVQSLDYWLAAAELWIDRYTGRTWGISSVSAEQHTLDRYDTIVFLNTYPVSAISAITARNLSLAATVTTLAATDYEIVDAAHGQILVSSNFFGQRLSVNYTVSVPVPADITLAATLLVTNWVQPMVKGSPNGSAGIKSYSIGQDLSVTFQDSGTMAALPAPVEVLRLVNPYRMPTYVT